MKKTALLLFFSLALIIFLGNIDPVLAIHCTTDADCEAITTGATCTIDPVNPANNFCFFPPIFTLTTITISPLAATINIGSTQLLTADPRDQFGNSMTAGVEIDWASSNTAVATVSLSGLVTGVSAGTANITASSTRSTGVVTSTAPSVITVSNAGGGGGGCGNGAIDAGEQCEPPNTATCNPNCQNISTCDANGNDPLAANSLVPCGQSPGCRCELRHLFVMALRIYNFIVWTIAVPLAGLLIVAGGILIMVSGGPGAANPVTGSISGTSLYSKGKSILTGSVAALIFIFGSWLFISIVLRLIGYTGTWSSF